MKISETTAREMLTQVGLPKSAKKPLAQVKKAVASLHERLAADKIKEPADPGIRDTLKRVCNALEAGESVEIEAATNGHAAKPAKGKSGKAKATKIKVKPVKAGKGKGKKKERTVTDDVHRGDPNKLDRFGSRVGSSNALVNKALTKTPQSFGEIVKKTGLTRGQVRYSHLEGLVKKKLVKKTNEGYALAK